MAHPDRHFSAAGEKALAKVRAICHGFPDVTDRLSHGAPTFWIREKKTFVMFVEDHHHDGRLAVWCAAPPGAMDAMIGSDPKRFYRPAYVAHRGWVGMLLDSKPDWGQVAAVLEDAYHTVVVTLPERRGRATAVPKMLS